MIDPPEVIGPRLRELRLALEIKKQIDFARAIGVEKNTYNPWEKGQRPLTFEGACLIRKRFGIPLDYLFFGAMRSEVPASILVRMKK
jgi:transcriptional regulator with XRE-family HTH domain